MVERRKHKRYSMPRGTFAILRSKVERLRNYTQMSIGEIAMILYKSQPEVMGQVSDMSLGGVALKAATPFRLPAGKVELDLLLTEQGIYLHNIPYVAVSDKPATKGRKKTTGTERNAFQFTPLDAELKSRLEDLLAHHIG